MWLSFDDAGEPANDFQTLVASLAIAKSERGPAKINKISQLCIPLTFERCLTIKIPQVPNVH